MHALLLPIPLNILHNQKRKNTRNQNTHTQSMSLSLEPFSYYHRGHKFHLRNKQKRRQLVDWKKTTGTLNYNYNDEDDGGGGKLASAHRPMIPSHGGVFLPRFLALAWRTHAEACFAACLVRKPKGAESHRRLGW
ncbi:hypothetical protein BS78_03G393700 [Paspalum vaginatum]|nr:hypothetical protein BS78_03G393700 [Paspalum vaginatum]